MFVVLMETIVACVTVRGLDQMNLTEVDVKRVALTTADGQFDTTAE